MISLDTETTGTDLRHGAMPYLVTIGQEDGTNLWYEWYVDPLTRKPEVPEEDVEAIRQKLETENIVILHNAKFDVSALATIGITDWPWHKTIDTLLAGHLLGSSLPHGLDEMSIQYLRQNIAKYEDALKEACKEARKIVKKDFPTWRIANEGLPEMPSVKNSANRQEDKPWKNDTWLPRLLAQNLMLGTDHPWWSVAHNYANVDSSITLALWPVLESEIERRGLRKIYNERLKLLPIAQGMESRGVTVSGVQLNNLEDLYYTESTAAEMECMAIARELGYDLVLPKSGVNNSLRHFMFEVLKLPKIINKKSKSDAPTLDKNAMEVYESTLPQGSTQLKFVQSLRKKRKRDTSLNFCETYRRFWVPIDNVGYYKLFPNLNPTGTDTLRWSSNNPNSQNVSKQEEASLRSVFGPAPGREWWSLDAQNLELRIPTFEAQEKELMDVFNRPKDPPYYGSYHLVVFDTLHPEMFKQHGKACKTLFEATWYQWVKNGNFAVIYGAQEDTADRTYHVPGAYKKIRHRFPRIAKLADKQIEFANRYGYVETIPDVTVDPERGYPLLCTRTEYGRVSPTIPLNYHVSGSAMQWMNKAMVRVDEFLGDLNRGVEFQCRKWRDGYYIAMQVHDELVLDMPARKYVKPGQGVIYGNLPVVKEVQRLMELGGQGISVPTPVTVEYHANNWSIGVAV